MNTLSVDTISFSSPPKNGKWARTDAVLSESSNVAKFGKLLSVISLSAPERFKSEIAGDLLIETLEDTYYGESDEKNIIRRLEKAIMSAAKRLEYLLQREKLVGEAGIDLCVTVAVIKNEFIYMAVLGEGKIMFYKDGELLDITQGLKDLTGRDLIKSGSGKCLPGVAFILLSPNATMGIEEKQLVEAIKAFDFKTVKIKTSDPGVACLVLKVTETSKKTDKVAATDESVIKTEHAKAQVKEKLMDEVDRVDNKEGKVEGKPSEVRKEKIEAVSEERKIEKGEGQTKQKVANLLKQKGSSNLNKLENLGGKIKDKLADKKTYEVILMKSKEFLLRVVVLFKKYIWIGLLGIGERGFFLRGRRGKKAIPLRGIIILTIVVLLGFFLSIRALQKRSEHNKSLQTVTEGLAGIDQEFVRGKSMGESGNIAEATTILQAAIDKLDKLRESGVLISEIDAKIQEGEGILDRVVKAVVLTDENRISDVAAYISGGAAQDMVLLSGKLYLVDKDRHALYELSTDGGEVKQVLGGETALTAPSSITYDSESKLLIFDGVKGILKIDLESLSVEEVAGLSITSVGNASDIANYTVPKDGTNVLYLLRPTNKDVQKVTRYSSGYSLPALRLASERFEDASDIEIDGKIYVLSQSMGILRYYGDVQDPYTLIGLDKPIGVYSALALDEKLVFIGDSVNSRVVIVAKGAIGTPQQGTYIAQIVYRGGSGYLKDIKEIIVDSKNRIMYILDGTKILKIGLSEVDNYATGLD